MLRIIYHLLRDGVVYTDLGGDYYQRRNEEKPKNRLIRKLEALSQ